MTSDEEYPEEVHQVTSEYVETRSHAWHHEGSNDQKRNRFEILMVVDSEGREFQPTWGEKPTELFPGVMAREENGVQHLHISRDVCPIRILFRWYAEYVSYTDSEHNSSWTTYYWIRYVR